MAESSILGEISECVVKGESEERVKELTQKAVDQGYQVREIVDGGLLAGLTTIGDMWREGEAFIPEVLLAAQVVDAGMEVIRDLIMKDGIKPIGKVVIGTVQGDVHSIGKSLVSMLMASSGFEVNDLGIDVPPEKFIEAVREQKPEIVGMSALLTTTMPGIADTIKALKEANLEVITMVGGAPVTQEYADSVGADGYAPDAISAIAKAKELLGVKA
jgi:5-methyltetrahydrofolate--homocysteine methyltransferase